MALYSSKIPKTSLTLALSIPQVIHKQKRMRVCGVIRNAYAASSAHKHLHIDKLNRQGTYIHNTNKWSHVDVVINSKNEPILFHHELGYLIISACSGISHFQFLEFLLSREKRWKTRKFLKI